MMEGLMRTILAEVVRYLVRSRRGRWCAVICAAILFGLFDFIVANWTLRAGLAPELHFALQTSIVGLGAGFTVWLILTGAAERRRVLEDEIRRVAELNLSVRNSLELIVLVHHDAADHEHKKMVLDCTAQIDRTLRDLFPVISDPGIEGGSLKGKRSGRELDRAS